MSVDATMSLDSVAMEIAKKLKDIKDAEREKIVLQNKLDVLSEQEEALRTRLNKLDNIITTTKYEISTCLVDVSNLTLIKKD